MEYGGVAHRAVGELIHHLAMGNFKGPAQGGLQIKIRNWEVLVCVCVSACLREYISVCVSCLNWGGHHAGTSHTIKIPDLKKG